MTPTGSPMADVPLPESTSRELVDLLLEEGEQMALQDAVAIEIEEFDHLDELVTGWGCSVSLPKPASKRSISYQRGAKKGSKAFPPDIDSTNIRIRCVSDDYNADHHRSAWKANVEPGTYRYINNNGIYRSSKFASVGKDWVTVKRSRHTDPASMTTAPEMRQAQKNLKKDLTQMFRPTETAKSEPTTRTVVRETPTPKPEINQQPSVTSAVALSEPTDRPATRDNCFKDPKLVKSASDLFVEKFSTRMDALQKSEKELQTTPLPRTPINASKSGSNARTSTNSSKRQDQQGYDSAQEAAADDIAKDVFTVKQVTRLSADQPLRPLEKLTPQQRSMDRGSGSECSSHQSRSEPESPVLPTSFMNAMNTFAQLHHHQHIRSKDAKSKSGPSTYRGRHKNSMGSTSASSNFSDSDSLNSVRNALSMTNTSIERMRMRPYAREFGPKDYAAKDYGKFLTGKYRLGATAATSTEPPQGNVQRKGIVGYRPNLPQPQTQSYAPQQMPGPIVTTVTSGNSGKAVPPVQLPMSTEELRSNMSDSSESYLSGTSMTVQRGSGRLHEPKAGGMALPEISGKRLPVTISSQRLL